MKITDLLLLISLICALVVLWIAEIYIGIWIYGGYDILALIAWIFACISFNCSIGAICTME